MRGRKTMLLGALAVALPITSLAVFSESNLMASGAAPVFPVACKLAGTVSFSPALTKTGTVTTSASAVTTMTISSGHLSACLSSGPLGPPNHGDLPASMNVSMRATRLGHGKYATGYCPAFLQSKTLKELKGLAFEITWGPTTFGASVLTAKDVTTASNTEPGSPEEGLNFVAKEGSGAFAEKSLNQITMFFDTADDTALTTGCSGGQTITSLTIDSTDSVVIL
jgi:hypothetical protein